ncbi:hypothetical protein DPMN_026825 [Dreissena polymorpha]|uniref:Uncharacterized protein n=1 Tax=Dreissena polymorpha TaxID=45954 RepID=A0A9D4LS07_DREPO|nr:hypothetical protein DPMN_026825 [Dreissena polymorpha]
MACVVFNGYGGGASTKDVTHKRRTKGIIGAEIKFDDKTPFKTKKMSVLSNVENKQRFIYLLCKHMEEKEICIVNAKIETAVKYALNVPTVVMQLLTKFGEDRMNTI